MFDHFLTISWLLLLVMRHIFELWINCDYRSCVYLNDFEMNVTTYNLSIEKTLLMN